MMHWRPKAWDASMRRAKLLVASAAGAGRWFSVGYGNSPVMHCGIASLLRGRPVMGAGRWFSVGLWQRPDEALVSPWGCPCRGESFWSLEILFRSSARTCSRRAWAASILPVVSLRHFEMALESDATGLWRLLLSRGFSSARLR